MLQRTQLMLDTDTKQDLMELATLTNQSMSQLVRRFVASAVKEEKKSAKRKTKKLSGVELLLKMAKEAERIEKKYGGDDSYPTDAALNHDHYLYGAPKKQLPKKLQKLFASL